MSIVGTGRCGQLNRDVTQSSTISQEEVLRSVRSGRVKGWIPSQGILEDFAQGLPVSDRKLVLAVQGQIYGPMFDET